MKNILPKFKVDNTVYYLLLITLLSGYIKIALIVIIIVTIHELGHITANVIFKYQISSITLYPFGGITKINKLINSPLNHEIIIGLSGFFFQGVLHVIFIILYNKGIINPYTYQIFTKYNLTILIFNLLPIIPLDGSVIFKTILEKYFSYQKSYIIQVLISIISLLLFIYYTKELLLNNLMIIFFLIYHLYDNLKNYKYLYNRFLLERYLYNLEYKKIINLKGINLKKLSKEKYYYYQKKDKVYSEKRILSEIFDRTA